MRDFSRPAREALVADVLGDHTVLLLLIKQRKDNELITVHHITPFTAFHIGERVDVRWCGRGYELISPYLHTPLTDSPMPSP